MSEFPTAEHEALFRLAIETWGLDAQVDMAEEECAEFILASKHLKRERVGRDALIDELADLRIMYEQLRWYFGPEWVDEAVEEKMGRLRERLDEAGAEVP